MDKGWGGWVKIPPLQSSTHCHESSTVVNSGLSGVCGLNLSGDGWKSSINRRQMVSKASTPVEWGIFNMHMYGLPWPLFQTTYVLSPKWVHLGHQMSVVCPSNEGTLLIVVVSHCPSCAGPFSCLVAFWFLQIKHSSLHWTAYTTVVPCMMMIIRSVKIAV